MALQIIYSLHPRPRRLHKRGAPRLYVTPRYIMPQAAVLKLPLCCMFWPFFF